MFYEIKTHGSFLLYVVLLYSYTLQLLSTFTKLKRVELLSHITFLMTKFSQSTVAICHIHAFQYILELFHFHSYLHNFKGQSVEQVLLPGLLQKVSLRPILLKHSIKHHGKCLYMHVQRKQLASQLAVAVNLSAYVATLHRK